MRAIFTDQNRSILCSRGAVRPAVLLGELGRQYSVNFFALPSNTRLGTRDVAERDIPDTVEARAVAWIVEARPGQVIPGFTREQSNATIASLNKMRSDLSDYLQWASEAQSDHHFRAVHVPRGSSTLPSSIVLAFFEPVLAIQASEDLSLTCPDFPPPVSTAGGRDERPVARPTHSGPSAEFAVRGQIDDLAVRAGTEAFKKASSATLAFTDNNEAGTTSFAINGVVGLGRTVALDDAVFGFVQYTLNDQETDIVGDNDDAKDVHTISPGIFYRHPLDFGNRIGGTLGFTGYATFDIRNDAQLLRARLVYSDVTVRFPRRGFLCGSERPLLIFYADCRMSAFVEAAEILDPGRNADLLDNIDDQYVGVGTELSLILAPRGPAILQPLSFKATYRVMGILSGALDDPERLELSLNYAIPLGPPAGGPGVTLGITRTLGENFETFQHENLWKLTLGFKF
jgi:hypothetical protein